MAKNIRGFSENLTDKFLNIIVKIKSSGDLKFEYKLKLKLMGGAMKFFLKKLLGLETFKSMVSWATKNFLKNL